MRAALPLEHRVRAVALDREGRLLDPAGLVLARRERLGLEAAPVRIALEHAHHLAGPERGLVTADALPDLDDNVLRVGGIGLDERELELLFSPLDLVLVLGRHL